MREFAEVAIISTAQQDDSIADAYSAASLHDKECLKNGIKAGDS